MELTPILNAAAKYFPKTTLLAEQYFNNLQVLACCDAAAHYNFVQYLVVAESLYYLVVYLDELLGAWRQLLLVNCLQIMSSSQCVIYWETCLFSLQEKISPLHREGKMEGNDWKTQHLSTFEGLLNLSPRIWEVDCWKFIEPLIMQTDRGFVQA